VRAGPAFVLIPSPLVGPGTFEPLRAELAALGHDASVVQGELPVGPPYWRGWATSIRESLPTGPAVLVGHSGAGPVLDLVADGDANVTTVIGLDASLIEPGTRLLDKFDDARLASPEVQEGFTRGVFPNPWRSPALWQRVDIALPDAERYAADSRELPLDWYRESLPIASTNAPHGYLAFVPNPFYAPIAQRCRERGWPVRELPGMHFHFLVNPVEVADALVAMVSELEAGE
jgi:hypothetical protein